MAKGVGVYNLYEVVKVLVEKNPKNIHYIYRFTPLQYNTVLKMVSSLEKAGYLVTYKEGRERKIELNPSIKDFYEALKKIIEFSIIHENNTYGVSNEGDKDGV